MATIRTAIQIQDKMTPAFLSMNKAMNIVLNTFESIQTASSNAVDTASIQAARNEIAKANVVLEQTEQEIRDTNNAQNQFNNSMRNGIAPADGLLQKVKQIALAVGGIKLGQKAFQLSDEVASNEARLSLIVDDGGSVAELENSIFASADRARGAYLDTANVVSKLGILAGDNFKNTDEIVAFTELMNKNFIIGGASIQEQTSAMYQLTQAMASGKLQGDEFRAIMENAPLLAEAIATYTGKSKGELKEMSSQGVITADIIKNAMFSMADETNARFDKMPRTWSQNMTKIQNIAIKAFQPVLKKINELANNPQMQEFFMNFINGASLVAQAVIGMVEAITWLMGVLEPLAPIIFGIVAAYVAFSIISGIVTTVLGIMSAAQAIQSAASMMEAGATMAATAAQWGLNSALFACPIVWIILLIIALIAILTYLWFTNDKVAYGILWTWDMLRIGAMTLMLGAKAAFYGILLAGQFLYLGLMTVVLGLMGAWYAFQTGLEAVCVGVLYVFQGLYNGILAIVNGIISVLNKIPGVSIDTAEYASFADTALDNMMDNVVDRNQKLQDMVDDMSEVSASIDANKAEYQASLSADVGNIQNKVIEYEDSRQDRVDHRNDWINGAGKAVSDAMESMPFDFEAMQGDIGDIAGNTGSIKDSMDITEEDLKYLRDLAEQEVVNRFTTAEISLNMTNNNTIGSDMDIDGVVDQMATGLEEVMITAAEGVHD